MLASTNRFHRRNHVNRVHKQGRAVRGRDVSLKFRYDERDSTKKVAVVVSKKVSKNAVVRNRIRRRVFEIIRLNLDSVDDGFQGVFAVFSESVAKSPHNELEKHIHDLLRKARKA